MSTEDTLKNDMLEAQIQSNNIYDELMSLHFRKDFMRKDEFKLFNKIRVDLYNHYTRVYVAECCFIGNHYDLSDCIEYNYKILESMKEQISILSPRIKLYKKMYGE